MSWNSVEERLDALKRADRAQNSSRVPASLDATTRHWEGFGRRVVLGGRGERRKSPDNVASYEGAIPSAEEADRAWNASLVPASICATTRHTGGF